LETLSDLHVTGTEVFFRDITFFLLKSGKECFKIV